MRMLSKYIVATSQPGRTYISIGEDQLNILYVGYGKDQVIQEITRLVKEFPEKRLCITKEASFLMYNALKEYEPVFTPTGFTIANIPQLNKKDLQFQGKPLLLVCKPEYYFEFNVLSEYFMDKERMRAKRLDEETIPLEYYEKNTRQLVEYSIGKYHAVNAHTMRESLYENTHECTEFKGNIAVALIKHFEMKRVLDFSAGRASRLIAALASNVEYTGIDPDQRLHPIYQEIIQQFASNEKRYTMICGKAQDSSLDIGRDYDGIITSPPYYNLEHYSDDTSQSDVEYTTLDAWLRGFFYPALSRSIHALKVGGVLCLNINDPGLRVKNRQPFTMQTIQYINKELPCEYLGCIGCSEGK